MTAPSFTAPAKVVLRAAEELLSDDLLVQDNGPDETVRGIRFEEAGAVRVVFEEQLLGGGLRRSLFGPKEIVATRPRPDEQTGEVDYEYRPIGDTIHGGDGALDVSAYWSDRDDRASVQIDSGVPVRVWLHDLVLYDGDPATEGTLAVEHIDALLALLAGTELPVGGSVRLEQAAEILRRIKERY